MRNKTDLIFIHCAATRPSQDVGAKEIDRWHRARGFLCIGYHKVIRRDGTVEDGRPLMDAGAHAVGYNSRSVAVCLVGGVAEDNVNEPEDNFTPEQYAALEQLLREWLVQFPGAQIVGHNAVAAKACPSFDWRKWLVSRGMNPGRI